MKGSSNIKNEAIKIKYTTRNKKNKEIKMTAKILSNELINENKPDPRIGWVYDLNMKCTRPT